MNLKESFRYKTYIGKLLKIATEYVSEKTNCLQTTKTHLRSKTHNEATDTVETITANSTFAVNDVIALIEALVKETEGLTNAIWEAKTRAGTYDIDTAIEVNKAKQLAAGAFKTMMRYKENKFTDSGRAYRFNVEGSQVPYIYDVEVETKLTFDKHTVRGLARKYLQESDLASAEIDRALVSVTVNFKPSFNLDDAFADVMEDFVAANKA